MLTQSIAIHSTIMTVQPSLQSFALMAVASKTTRNVCALNQVFLVNDYCHPHQANLKQVLQKLMKKLNLHSKSIRAARRNSQYFATMVHAEKIY